MAQLIDIILVTIVVGMALWAMGKYFYKLWQKPKGDSISCAGCNSTCQPDIPENPSLGLLRKIK